MGSADTTPVGRRQQRRLHLHDLSRTQLLDAAEEVFGRKGYHEATVREIAEEAEFSVGSVYSFFANKDDLFVSVFLRRGDELLPALRSVVESDDGPLAQLHRLVDVEVGFFREHAVFGRLYLRTSSTSLLSPDRPVDQAMRGRFQEAMDLHATVFRRGQAAGELCSGPPAVLARLFSSLVAAFQASDPDVMGDEAGDEGLDLSDLHDVVERAFAAGSGRSRARGAR